MSERQEPFYDALNECGPTTAWEPRPDHTMTDLMRQYFARQPGKVCHLEICWCGRLRPDWVRLCFTCAPATKAYWIKEANNG